MLIIEKILKYGPDIIGDLTTTALDLLEENNPNHKDSMGQLIYKLSCVTIQMWFNQDLLFSIRKMNLQEFEKKYHNNIPDLHKIIKRCCDLNCQRSILMDAIDNKRAVDVIDGKRSS